MRLTIAAFCLFLSCAWAASQTNLIPNAGFESEWKGWRPLWSRQAGAGKAALEQADGRKAARIEHSGSEDWSLEPDIRIPVRPGEIYELKTDLKLQGDGSATLCVSTWDDRGRNASWSHGERSTRKKNWKQLKSRFVIPQGIAQIQPRLIGHGGATVWLAGMSLVKQPGLENIQRQAMPARLLLTNALLEITANTGDATLSVLDRRTGRHWNQKALQSDVVVTAAQARDNGIELEILDATTTLKMAARIELDPTRPEFTLALSSEGDMDRPVPFPHPFASQPGDRLVVPMNEGISYPVEDKSVETFRLIAYGGHGICMAFWGVTDDRAGYGTIIETPDDAAIHLRRIDGRLAIAPEWDAQKGRFGYTRRLRYAFFDQGGHVAIAKRYREHARQTGHLKTLEEKRRENPNVDLLVGAVNVWSWDRDPVTLAKEMQAAGIDRILWSGGGSPESVRTLNDMKVLTSRYDIYQDVMDPANFPFLNGKHGDWPAEAWPNDIIAAASGDWLRGWGVRGKMGEWYYCGVICDKQAPDYARKRIPADLATRPYLCRFIDTTTAAPWNECYNTNHPMTRSESREWKMKLLDVVSREMKLVTGCETGHDASVPFLHYFEGMLSLGPYRVPDAGRDIQRIWTNAPDNVVRYQLGHEFRLPLWELVYHDCVVAQWYWGDYNNKLPALWDKRDLFNVLYGTPPMFMFDRKLWASEKERFVRSYKNTCPYVRAAGYSEMTDHRILTPDRNVQQTVFANGLTITVNFGTSEYRQPSGELVSPMAFHASGIR